MGLVRIDKLEPSNVSVLAPGDGHDYGYWWGTFGRVALGPARVFFSRFLGSVWQVCGVDKLGGDPLCDEPLPDGLDILLWNTSVYFYDYPQILRMDPETAATSKVASALVSLPEMWVDGTSVFWLAKGDLYRIDK